MRSFPEKPPMPLTFSIFPPGTAELITAIRAARMTAAFDGQLEPVQLVKDLAA